MTDHLPVKYDETDLAKARRRGKYVGWVQGGAAVFLGGFVLQLLGWIPAILVTGGVIYVLYKLLSGGKKDDGVDDSSEA